LASLAAASGLSAQIMVQPLTAPNPKMLALGRFGCADDPELINTLVSSARTTRGQRRMPLRISTKTW